MIKKIFFLSLWILLNLNLIKINFTYNIDDEIIINPKEKSLKKRPMFYKLIIIGASCTVSLLMILNFNNLKQIIMNHQKKYLQITIRDHTIEPITIEEDSIDQLMNSTIWIDDQRTKINDLNEEKIINTIIKMMKDTLLNKIEFSENNEKKLLQYIFNDDGYKKIINAIDGTKSQKDKKQILSKYIDYDHLNKSKKSLFQKIFKAYIPLIYQDKPLTLAIIQSKFHKKFHQNHSRIPPYEKTKILLEYIKKYFKELNNFHKSALNLLDKNIYEFIGQSHFNTIKIQKIIAQSLLQNNETILENIFFEINLQDRNNEFLIPKTSYDFNESLQQKENNFISFVNECKFLKPQDIQKNYNESDLYISILSLYEKYISSKYKYNVTIDSLKKIFKNKEDLTDKDKESFNKIIKEIGILLNSHKDLLDYDIKNFSFKEDYSLDDYKNIPLLRQLRDNYQMLQNIQYDNKNAIYLSGKKIIQIAQKNLNDSYNISQNILKFWTIKS